jgi:Primase C terminal 2 (PriCT-2)/Bifunctional DNA primase/polymerase, N-terminal
MSTDFWISEYRRRGWSLVPTAAGSKRPTAQGWQTRAWAPQDFAPGANVSVILGQRSGHPVDIDLDCSEALALADIYLPPTDAIFGRASKPRSHRLYISAGAVFEAFADPLSAAGNMLLELRAEGRDGGAHQTLIPPSIADGERREWEGETIEPAVFDAAKLRRRCAYLAIGCLIRRYVSEHTSERPAPDLPHLLYEAEPILGRAAYRWLGMPDPDAPQWQPKRRRDYSQAEIDLAELVDSIPNDCDWHGWNRVGMAIFAASGGSDQGGIIFDAWSAKSPRYNPYETVARWRHWHKSPPSRLTVGTLVHLARQAGWQPPRSSETA